MIDAIYFYKIERFFYKWKIPILPKIIQGIIFIIYNSYIPYQADIGQKTSFGYGGIGVVIHSRAKIGSKVVIGSNVTIGGRSGKYEVPKIGDNVYISTGAKILGAISIGENSIIGANAVVINDVPPYAVVAGVPAKVIKYLSKVSDNVK